LIALVIFFLYRENALNVDSYIKIQKDSFFFINSKLSQFPNVIYNLTQLGDALISLSLLSIFLIYAPVVWESLISASLISMIFSSSLKNYFAVPRPAAVFDHSSFVIIGKVLPGHSSLPSGHSITVFTTLTVLLFAFLSQKNRYHILTFLFIIVVGFMLAFTRVGVGVGFHYWGRCWLRLRTDRHFYQSEIQVMGLARQYKVLSGTHFIAFCMLFCTAQ
jgi:membrane-associated phospholipid phosphatase